MLFVIENCEPDKYDGDLGRLTALSNILQSHGLGKNIVIGKKKTMEDVIDSDLYSFMDKRNADNVLATRRGHGQLRKLLSVYVIIDFNFEGVAYDTLEGKTLIRAGYEYFIEPENAGAVSLITENTLDFQFYNMVAEYYSKHVSKQNLNITFREYLGAGSHSKSEFDRLSRGNRLLLCIVDNDKKHPVKGEGSTSSAFTAIDRTYDGMTLAKVIDVREVESLIPASIIKQVYIGTDDDKINLLNEIQSYNRANPLFRTYFDHKDGLTLKQAIELDETYGDFWLDALSVSHRFSSKMCFDEKTCYNCEVCPTVEGFGKSLLSQSVNLLQKYNLKYLTKELDDYLHSHWDDIGELMMSWGCSGNGGVVRS